MIYVQLQSGPFHHSWLITGFVTKKKRRVPHVEQELHTLTEHLSSPSVFSGVRVTRPLVLYVVFCRLLYVLFSFFFWPLCCLSSLRPLVTPLVSSNLSYTYANCYVTKIKYIMHKVHSDICDCGHFTHMQTTLYQAGKFGAIKLEIFLFFCF